MRERLLRTRWFRQTAVVWFAATLALDVASASQIPQSAERFGGIEIGAKGVKATVVEVVPSTGTLPKTIMNSDYISNTTLAEGVVKTKKFSSAAIQETAEEAGKFARRIREEFKVPSDRIRVVGSSGLPKEATNRDDLINAVRAATGLAPMTFLDPPEEVKLTILGLPLTEAERGESLLVDVGSGNTKGGLLGRDNRFVYFTVPLGSVTYANRVTQNAPGKPFAQMAAQLRPSLVESPLAEQVRSHPELARRGTVFLVGGAPYALTTILHPEAVREKRVVLTTKDIEDYERLLQNSREVPKPNLASIRDPETRAAAEDEWRNVRDHFKVENLIAGAELLTALSSTLEFSGKQLIFDRSAITAWIRAKVTPASPSSGSNVGQGSNGRVTVPTSPSESVAPSANGSAQANGVKSFAPMHGYPVATGVYPCPQSPRK